MISYNNGKIGSKICSLAKDSAASMNLKRAIVSAFQVSSVQEQKNQLFEVSIFVYFVLPKNRKVKFFVIKSQISKFFYVYFCHQTDVQGTCNTTYSMSSAGQSNMITKFKDLSQCTGYDKINLLASQSQFSQVCTKNTKHFFEKVHFIVNLLVSSYRITKLLHSQKLFNSLKYK